MIVVTMVLAIGGYSLMICLYQKRRAQRTAVPGASPAEGLADAMEGELGRRTGMQCWVAGAAAGAKNLMRHGAFVPPRAVWSPSCQGASFGPAEASFHPPPVPVVVLDPDGMVTVVSGRAGGNLTPGC